MHYTGMIFRHQERCSITTKQEKALQLVQIAETKHKQVLMLIHCSREFMLKQNISTPQTSADN